jgi:UDP-2,3-diacylglucosamine pyrophosphatase LpxH
MKTVIISDIHLGSKNCQAGWLLRFLGTNFNRLIVNGDTINNLNLKKLKDSHWAVLDRLREIGLQRELIMIRGNHDGRVTRPTGLCPAEVLPALLGVPVQDEYQLEMGNRHYLILHGDRFDPTVHRPIITDAADWCYQTVQKVNKKAAKWLKRKVKKVGGVLELVKRQSVRYVQALGCQGVITGHTHFPLDEWIDGVHYLNSGCWVDRPCTYLYAHNDRIELRTWDADTRDARENESTRLILNSTALSA